MRGGGSPKNSNMDKDSQTAPIENHPFFGTLGLLRDKRAARKQAELTAKLASKKEVLENALRN